MKISSIGWNLGGLAAPLLFAAVSVPVLVKQLGNERFGLLALAWALIGFAGVFDLGIGRATTHLLAHLRGSGRLADVPVVISTAVRLALKSGVIGTGVLLLVIASGAPTYIKYSAELGSEVSVAAIVISLTIPVQALSAMFKGVNEAFENFAAINLLRVGLGAANFLGPMLVASFTRELPLLVGTLLISRLAALVLYRWCAASCIRKQTGLHITEVTARSNEIARKLLHFGGWFTVSSIVNPFLAHADRFLIGGIISAAAVASYAIPFDVVVQSLVVVGAITTAIFPSLTALLRRDPDAASRSFYKWLAIATGAIGGIAIILAGLVDFIFPLWLGDQMPAQASEVGKVLCLGLVPYAVGTMYVALIHAHGRPDITAKCHVLEFIIVLPFLYWVITHHGVLGAAWAWTGRLVLETAAFVVWFYARQPKAAQVRS